MCRVILLPIKPFGLHLVGWLAKCILWIRDTLIVGRSGSIHRCINYARMVIFILSVNQVIFHRGVRSNVCDWLQIRLKSLTRSHLRLSSVNYRTHALLLVVWSTIELNPCASWVVNYRLLIGVIFRGIKFAQHRFGLGYVSSRCSNSLSMILRLIFVNQRRLMRVRVTLGMVGKATHWALTIILSLLLVRSMNHLMCR